jgi:hypothetical protein
MAHHKKSEREWKKHVAAERHNYTRTHYHHIRKIKEENESVKETVKTKRDAEDKVFPFNFGKWWKNFKPAIKVAAPAAPVPAEELSTQEDLESVVVEVGDPDSPAEEVELAPVPPPRPWSRPWWWF